MVAELFMVYCIVSYIYRPIEIKKNQVRLNLPFFKFMRLCFNWILVNVRI